MGKIEERGRTSAKRVKIQSILLASLYAAGAISLLALAPNAVRLLRYADPYMDRKLNPTRRMSQALSRMQARGLVRRLPTGAFELTTRGKLEASRMYSMLDVLAPKPRKWDGRWRIVTFDIWERRRQVRRRLRDILHMTGIIRLQNSVWIYPYDCEELVGFIRADLRLGPSILYFVADGVENDTRIKKQFGLT